MQTEISFPSSTNGEGHPVVVVTLYVPSLKSGVIQYTVTTSVRHVTVRSVQSGGFVTCFTEIMASSRLCHFCIASFCLEGPWPWLPFSGVVVVVVVVAVVVVFVVVVINVIVGLGNIQFIVLSNVL